MRTFADSPAPIACVGDVHRPALAAVRPGHLPVELGHHGPDVDALGDAVPVTAVRRRDPVVLTQRRAHADGDRFLPDVEMNGADGHTVFHQPLEALFELADEDQVFEHPPGLFRRRDHCCTSSGAHTPPMAALGSVRQAAQPNDVGPPIIRQGPRLAVTNCSPRL